MSVSNHNLGLLTLIDLDQDTSESSRLFRLDTSKAAPVTVDLNAGVPQGMPSGGDGLMPVLVTGLSVVGTARGATLGKDVVIACSNSHGGSLLIEESPNGTTWDGGALLPLNAPGNYGIRFSPRRLWYRCTFIAPAGFSVSKVFISSQVRDVGT